MQICCKTNRSCVMFKCAGPKAATWGRDGGSEHVGGRGDPPENTYQFLLIGSLGFMFLQDVCNILHNTWERKHIFIIHIQMFWSAESIHIIWQVYIYVVKLIVHVSCSNVQDPKPPLGDEMEVLSTLVVQETDRRTPTNFCWLGVWVSCFSNNQFCSKKFQIADVLIPDKYIVLKRNISCGTFKCSGPKATMRRGHGGSQHWAGRGDRPQKICQFAFVWCVCVCVSCF
jgi:hypothetical protein